MVTSEKDSSENWAVVTWGAMEFEKKGGSTGEELLKTPRNNSVRPERIRLEGLKFEVFLLPEPIGFYRLESLKRAEF